MAEKTGISWTDSTVNPIRGCSPVSSGCAKCYAASLVSGPRCPPGYEGLAQNGKWTGEIRWHPKALGDLLRWGPVKEDGRARPRRVFLPSMGDLFHEGVKDEWRDQVFAAHAVTGHTLIVATKRPHIARAYLAGCDGRVEDTALRLYRDRMAGHFGAYSEWRRRLWLLASCEDQDALDARVPDLLACDVGARGLSLEPLLGPIDLGLDLDEPYPEQNEAPGGFLHRHDCPNYCDFGCGGGFYKGARPISWVIVGSESNGPRPGRPCELDWVRSIRDQCQAAGCALFVKQLPIGGRLVKMPEVDGVVWSEFPEVSNG